MIGAQMTTTKPRKRAGDAGQMLRAARKAERDSGTGGTGFTILKLRQPPIGMLIDKDKIGPEEIEAAREIEQAFYALSSRLMVRGGLALDRVDKSSSDNVPWPALTAKAVKNYQAWADHWSKRHKAYGDPMLEVIIAAVIDERSIRAIGTDLGFRHSKIERAVIAGLRDYAARAGMASSRHTAQWKDEAERVFVTGDPVLLDAIRRARIEV